MSTSESGSTGALLAAALRGAAVDAIYGDPIDGLGVVPVRSTGLAQLLATTHLRITGRVALVASGRDLRAPGSSPAAVAHGRAFQASGPSRAAIALSTPADVAALPSSIPAGDPSGYVIDLQLDLAAPADGLSPEPAPSVDRWMTAPDGVAEAIAAASAPIVLAGPGVIRAGAVPGLHALAAAGRLGVLNTWGAKGVFDWRSRHHLATAGLQEWDFDLAGVPDADLVIATGVDVDEAPTERWHGANVVTVDPRVLSSLAELVSRAGEWLPVPELRHRLAAVTQQGWADAGPSLAPTAATRSYGTVLGEGGRVSADAGPAGFWVARTFSTTELGSAQVPATVIPGFAAAVALVTRLASPSRKVLAVVDGEPSEQTRQLLDLADQLGCGFAVEAWRGDGEVLDAEAHMRRLGRLAVADRSEVVTLAPAGWQLDRVVEAAGAISAWGGLAAR